MLQSMQCCNQFIFQNLNLGGNDLEPRLKLKSQVGKSVILHNLQPQNPLYSINQSHKNVHTLLVNIKMYTKNNYPGQ